LVEATFRSGMTMSCCAPSPLEIVISTVSPMLACSFGFARPFSSRNTILPSAMPVLSLMCLTLAALLARALACAPGAEWAGKAAATSAARRRVAGKLFLVAMTCLSSTWVVDSASAWPGTAA
jgi:hypothetical protein